MSSENKFINTNIKNAPIEGNDGNNVLTGAGTFIGGKGNDTINAKVAGSSDTFIFGMGDGKDVINSIDTAKVGEKGSDTIELKDYNKSDMICQRVGNNLILIFSPNDQITLTNYFAGVNYQTIDTVKFADGEVWNIKNQGISLEGTEKNDNITGSIWNDTIRGGAGNDTITDINGNNYLNGGAGNDKITGKGTFEGGTGNDTLTASVAASSDKFIFSKGDGYDTITSLDTAKEKGKDTLTLKGINRGDVITQRVGNNLVFVINGGSDQITFTNYFLNANYQTLEQVVFADGSIWKIKEEGFALAGTEKNDNITGSIWNDTISGGAGNDIITDIHGSNHLYGDEGNDKITGKGTLEGGTGDDTLTANVAGSHDTFIFNNGDGKDVINSLDTAKEKGSDTIELTGYNKSNMTCQRVGNNLILILGGETSGDQITLTNYFAGVNYQTIDTVKFADGTSWTIKEGIALEGTNKNDNITGSIWNDTIRGGAGNDIITDIHGINYLNGGEGNDKITGAGTLVGGLGDDTLTANVAGSSDTFTFNKGDGKDTIISVDTAKEKGKDTLLLEGFYRSEVTTQRVGNNLVFVIEGGDQITFSNYYLNANNQTLEAVKFKDGTWDITTEGFKLKGTDKNDNITGSTWNDRIEGGKGNDTITDIHGDNYLDGGEGNDRITGKGTLVGGTGDDILTANVAGSSDTFIFTKGDGKDVINSLDTAKEKGSDTIKLQGYNKSDLTYQRVGNNLILILGDKGDQITLTSYFAGANYQTIDTVTFADGTSWTIKEGITLTGTAKNDNITGSTWNDTINGGAGNDIITDINGSNLLNGEEGNDKITGAGTLVGGLGDDTLTANVAGSHDTFIFNKGDGKDVINSLDTAKEKGSDTIELKGYNKSDMVCQRVGNNLILILGDKGDQITLTNYFAGVNYQTIDTVTFADGSAWNIKADGLTLKGTDKNDNITGSTWDDRIEGGLGNDIITDIHGDNYLDGGAGNDKITGKGTLVGGLGDDTLTANVAGSSDTFTFNKGDGKDTIISLDTAKENKGKDTLRLTNISKADVTTQRVGNNLVLVIKGGDQITLSNYFLNANYQTLEKVVFDDGAWNIKEDGFTFMGTDKNDNITGSIWNDTIRGGKGNDVITDIHGSNLLDGEEGNDKITGAGTLVGGKGNDTLTANVAGSSDTFIFHIGDGQDTITCLDTASQKGADTLQFEQNISRGDLIGEKKGNNLIIRIGASGDQITLTNFFLGGKYQTITTAMFGLQPAVSFDELLAEILERGSSPRANYASYESQTNGLIDAMAAFAPATAANSLIQDKPFDLGNMPLAVNAS